MRGITRSLTMMVGRNSVTFASASSPSAAAATAKPQVRVSSVSPTRADSSSSTISTRWAAIAAFAASVTGKVYHRRRRADAQSRS